MSPADPGPAPPWAGELSAQISSVVAEVDWAAFSAALSTQLDDALAPLDEATREALAAPPLPADFAPALSARLDAVDAELAPLAEAAREALSAPLPAEFSAGVSRAIGAAEAAALAEPFVLPVALSPAPQSRAQRALFAEELSGRIDALAVSTERLLREANRAELRSREGSWEAFAAGVWRQIDASERLLAQRPLEEQARLQLAEQVEGELQAIAPRLDARFLPELEQRIWKEAAPREGLLERLSRWWSAKQGWAGAAAMAGAAAVAAFFWVQSPAPVAVSTQLGEVAVEQVTIEGGAVTVMPGEGLTLIMVSEAS